MSNQQRRLKESAVSDARDEILESLESLVDRMTIKFTLYVERPATQDDVDAQDAWLKTHPGTSSIPTLLGEMIDAEDEHELPAVWEICNRCRGNGTHSNPSIDGNGITMDEWNGPDWDDESREMYMSGGYDVGCEECTGSGKVLVIASEDQLNPEQRKLKEQWEKQENSAAQSRAEDAYTRRMESGGDAY